MSILNKNCIKQVIIILLMFINANIGATIVYAQGEPTTGSNVNSAITTSPKVKPPDVPPPQSKSSQFQDASQKISEDKLNVSSLPGPTVQGGRAIDLLNQIIAWLVGLAGAIAMFILIIRGFKAISGTEEGFKDLRGGIVQVAAGLIVIFCSYLVVAGLFSIFYVNESQGVTSASMWTFIPAGLDADEKKAFDELKNTYPVTKEMSDCLALSTIQKYDYANQAAKFIGLKFNCGNFGFEDVKAVIRHFIAVLYNYLGTLAVIALIISGYTFLLANKGTEAGTKRLKFALYGLLISALAFPAFRILLNVLYAL